MIGERERRLRAGVELYTLMYQYPIPDITAETSASLLPSLLENLPLEVIWVLNCQSRLLSSGKEILVLRPIVVRRVVSVSSREIT
jgi:hypothetical protein